MPICFHHAVNSFLSVEVRVHSMHSVQNLRSRVHKSSSIRNALLNLGNIFHNYNITSEVVCFDCSLGGGVVVVVFAGLLLSTRRSDDYQITINRRIPKNVKSAD